MHKKLSTILISLCLCLSLAACNSVDKKLSSHPDASSFSTISARESSSRVFHSESSPSLSSLPEKETASSKAADRSSSEKAQNQIASEQNSTPALSAPNNLQSSSAQNSSSNDGQGRGQTEDNPSAVEHSSKQTADNRQNMQSEDGQIGGQASEGPQNTQPTTPIHTPDSEPADNGANANNFNTYDNPEQQQTTASYVLNTNTMKFHHPWCRSVKKISPENYEAFDGERDSVIAQGYDPCGICKP